MRKIFALMLISAFICRMSVLCGQSLVRTSIDAELQNILDREGDEMISVNIILKSQIDNDKLRSMTEKIADRKARRDVLIDEMKLFAEKEQEEILSILSAEEKNGRVSDIKRSWISNYINCRVSRDMIYLLSGHPDVLIIGLDEEEKILWDDVPKTKPSMTSVTDNVVLVNADDVWELGVTGKGVVVAVIDSGVNYNHIDLADHLWDGGEEFPNHGYDIYYEDNDPMDNFGHGTHCAGTVCGDGSSGTKTGMAPDATLMCVKVISDEGRGSVHGVNNGIEWAVEHYADVLSMSLGFHHTSYSEKLMLRRVCENAFLLDVVASVGVGNAGNKQWMYAVPNNVGIPGGCPPPWLHPEQSEQNAGGLSCVVAVGATDYNDVAADFTSRGPVTWQNSEYADYPYNPGIGLIRPDVCAPGVDVLSLDYENINGFTIMSGTSMATPCVAGVMALMLEKNPKLTPSDICMILETTAHKISPYKNNITGSGRIDALAAVEAVFVSDLKLTSFKINDKVTGNDNDKVNKLEQVKLDVTLENMSENVYDNVTAVLTTNYSNVNITDSIAQIGRINSQGEIMLTDKFEFVVADDMEVGTLLYFYLSLYDENDDLIDRFKMPLKLYGKQLVLSSVIIKNDDNNNGILELGETADLGIVLNNIGNEIAVAVNGVLSSDDDNIIINTKEASFSSISEESSSVAYFNVSLSDNANDAPFIPFEIALTEYDSASDENTETFTFDYYISCDLQFVLRDNHGDGWNDASLNVKYSDETPDDTLTVKSGYYRQYVRNITPGVEVTLEWNKGTYDDQCSIVVELDNGTVVYSKDSDFEDGYLYSWIHNCSIYDASFDMCEAVGNLELTSSQEQSCPPSFVWDAPLEGEVLHYEIYRNSKFMGVTEENNFTDETALDSVSYIYSVCPVYEECKGLMSHVAVNSVDNLNENNHIEISVYPNPSHNDFNIVCDNMKRVTVFNIMGSVIMDAQVNDSKYAVSIVDAGVYFITIETDKGNVVHKVVKLL